MGKIDDMRRRREALHAQQEGSASSEPTEVAAEDAPTDRGSCAVCGKTRPLQGGVVAVHQRGLGKVCAGSRKAPG
jgi:hypothetical protein